MEKYKLIVNRKHQGFIRSKNVEKSIKDMYPNVSYEIKHEEKEVHLNASVQDLMT